MSTTRYRRFAVDVTVPANVDTVRSTLTVGDVTMRLRLRWLAPLRGWYVDLLTPEGVPIATTRRLCIGVDVIADHTDDRVPPGPLLPLRADGRGDDLVRRDDLGDGVTLYYLEPA